MLYQVDQFGGGCATCIGSGKGAQQVLALGEAASCDSCQQNRFSLLLMSQTSDEDTSTAKSNPTELVSSFLSVLLKLAFAIAWLYCGLVGTQVGTQVTPLVWCLVHAVTHAQVRVATTAVTALRPRFSLTRCHRDGTSSFASV
jgi:xanthosine utilization system XapX-like protein